MGFLQSPHMGNNSPPILYRYLMFVRRHIAYTIADHIIDIAIFKSAHFIGMKIWRWQITFRDDNAFSIPITVVTGAAKYIESLICFIQ